MKTEHKIKTKHTMKKLFTLLFAISFIASHAQLTISGTNQVANGGTSNTTFTAYSVICAGTTSTGAFQNVSGLGTSGQVLQSNGASALPTWQTLSGTTQWTTSGANIYFNSGNVGIGTSSPTQALHVVGSIKMVDGNQGANKVLTSDANGVGFWQTGGGGGSQWTTTGNDIYYNTGKVGMGISSPTAISHVASTGTVTPVFLTQTSITYPSPTPTSLSTFYGSALRVNQYGNVMIGNINVNDAMLEIRGNYPASNTEQYLLAIKDSSLNMIPLRIRGDGQIEMNGYCGFGIAPYSSIRHYIAGFGTSSSTFSLACVDGSGNNIFSARDNGAVQVNPVYPYTFAPDNAFNVTGANQTTLTLYNNLSNVNLFTEDAFAIDKGATLSLGGKFGSGAGDFYGFASLRGAKENSTDGNGDGYMAFYTLRQGTGTVEAMRITSQGKAGIGTTSPSEKLTVAGRIRSTNSDIAIESSSRGLILKDTQATPHYWRITISNAGVLTTTDVGTTLPAE